MKEQELLEFIEWIPKNIKEFANHTREQIVEALNELGQSEEGKSAIQQMVEMFQESKQPVFKKGGKVKRNVRKCFWGAAIPVIAQVAGSVLSKNKSGNSNGKVLDIQSLIDFGTPGYYNPDTFAAPVNGTKKPSWQDIAKSTLGEFSSKLGIYQRGGVYNRQEARERKHRVGGVDEYGNMLVRGDQNVLAKKAKAASVKGFDESMYNYDPDQEFDRARYRARKRAARTINPEWTRRQRKAYALIDYYPTKDTELPSFPETSRPTPIGVVSVGDLTHSIEPSVVTPTTKQHIRRKVGRYLKPDSNSSVSWDQFAGTMYDALEKSGAFVGGQDSRAIQAWIANEYRKYSQNPYEYVYTQMPDDYVSSSRFLADEKTMQELGLSGYRSGAGYYDPNSTDFASVALRGNKSQKQLWEEAKANGAKAPIYWEQYYEDAEGNRYDDAEQARLHKLYGTEASWYDYGQKGTATQQEQKMDRVPESQFSNALNDMIVTALMTGTSGAANYTASAAKGIWDGAKTGYKTAKGSLDAFRSYYDDVARAYNNRIQPLRGGWRQGHRPNGQFGPVEHFGNTQYNGTYANGSFERYPSLTEAMTSNPGATTHGINLPEYIAGLNRVLGNYQRGGQILKGSEVINTPSGPIFETEDGEYVDIDGRLVDYRTSKISQWKFNRDLQRRWENDALSQAAIDGKVVLDTFDNKPWENMNRAEGTNPQMVLDTIVVRKNDNGSEDRERARSFKTFWSRKLFGDSKFDKINREYEKETGK